MADVAGIFAIIYFFKSIIDTIKYFVIKGRKQGIGTVTAISESKGGSRKEAVFNYDISIDNVSYSYKECKNRDDGASLRVDTAAEWIINESNKTVMPIDNLKALKKGLYMNPIICVVSSLLFVLFIYLGTLI